ncbi:MAG: hypothetical protein ACREXQ_16335, partial [Polaromonas sp.]
MNRTVSGAETDEFSAGPPQGKLAPSGGSVVHEVKSVGATFIRGRFQQWWQGRLPLSDSVTLTQRNVYILP